MGSSKFTAIQMKLFHSDDGRMPHSTRASESGERASDSRLIADPHDHVNGDRALYQRTCVVFSTAVQSPDL